MLDPGGQELSSIRYLHADGQGLRPVRQNLHSGGQNLSPESSHLHYGDQNLFLGQQYLHACGQDSSPGIPGSAHCAQMSGALSSLPPRFPLSRSTRQLISCPLARKQAAANSGRGNLHGGRPRGERIRAVVPANFCASMNPEYSVTSRVSVFNTHREVHDGVLCFFYARSNQ